MTKPTPGADTHKLTSFFLKQYAHYVGKIDFWLTPDNWVHYLSGSTACEYFILILGFTFLQTVQMNKHCNDDDECQTNLSVIHMSNIFFSCFASETIRSRHHVQAQGYVMNPIIVPRGPKIQCVARK